MGNASVSNAIMQNFKSPNMGCSFKFEVRQIMMLVSNDLQRKRHFCFDANPYAIGRRGLRRNRNVWKAASSELSHFELECTHFIWRRGSESNGVFTDCQPQYPDLRGYFNADFTGVQALFDTIR